MLFIGKPKGRSKMISNIYISIPVHICLKYIVTKCDTSRGASASSIAKKSK